MPDCIELLLPVSDTSQMLYRLLNEYPNQLETSDMLDALAHAVAKHQKHVLEYIIDSSVAPVWVRKM